MQTTCFKYGLVAVLAFGLQLRDLVLGRVFQRSDFNYPVTAQQDVGTTAGHVGGNGDSPRTTGLSDVLGFLVVVLGVTLLVFDAFFLQQARHVFGAFDGR